MFIVYSQTNPNTTPTIEGIFRNKENALKFLKEIQHINPDKRITISHIIDDSAYDDNSF